ncbi:DNA alkylation repair protein [Prevotella cerevisiae]|uniref:DNA alkylation repair protein n=1 Tax=Segatella cerevisiae TaxID=2053716 RepID=A0ABT1BW55_9BACT|nr:DNA alkylation repair protein [Segatella cerevisiae]MCO6024935.1 DNA alkylation repair protein [Segatella cerevisiae]
MKEDTKEKLNTIKRSFRLRMNGPAAASMREKGLDYKVNWGVNFVELKNMAREYGKDEELAIELWKEDIRECKILATLIMPPEKMLPDLAEVWMEQIRGQEMAEMIAFNLLQYAKDAPMLAYQYIASDKETYQITGFSLLARLFMKGQEPNSRGINEFLDQAAAALQGKSLGVRHAAANSVRRFAQLGEVYLRMARSAMKGLMEID